MSSCDVVAIAESGREWVHWTLSGTQIPPGGIEVSADGGTTWHPTVRDGDRVRVLIAGARAAGYDAITLQPGPHRLALRAVEAPEIIVRDAGTLVIA